MSLTITERFEFTCNFRKTLDIGSGTLLGTKWNSSEDITINNIGKCSLTMISSVRAGFESMPYAFSVKFLLITKKKSLISEIQLWLDLNLKSRDNHEFLLKNNNSHTFTSNTDVIYDIDSNVQFKRSEFNAIIQLSFKMEATGMLVKDIKRMHLNGDYSDCKIIAQDEVFDVHKCIISARSEVIKTMLNIDMSEKSSSEITLLEWDSIAVRELVKYMYSDTCHVAIVAHDLFRLAHFLEIPELQNACASYLESNINGKSIISTLRLVDNYELKELRKEARDFVKLNLADLIKCPKFLDYLQNNITLGNIAFVMETADEYKKDVVFSKALEFVKGNLKYILINDCLKPLASSNPLLLYKIFKSSFQ